MDDDDSFATEDDCEDDDIISVNEVPEPPDGGYGWVIVFACLISNIIVDGISFTYSMFFADFQAHFKQSNSKTSMIGSTLIGTYLCLGPVVGALVNKFGCRPVSIIGSLIATLAFFASTFTTNINVMIIVYGVFGGIGFGCLYLPSIVSVGYYFEKRRALATGIAVCGSGIGTFIFAPISRLLLNQYDWKNAMFILAGIILQGCICGALMRPLEMPAKLRAQQHPSSSSLLERIKTFFKPDDDFVNGGYYRNRFESGSMRDSTFILEEVRKARQQRLDRLRQMEGEMTEVSSSASSDSKKFIAREMGPIPEAKNSGEHEDELHSSSCNHDWNDSSIALSVPNVDIFDSDGNIIHEAILTAELEYDNPLANSTSGIDNAPLKPRNVVNRFKSLPRIGATDRTYQKRLAQSQDRLRTISTTGRAVGFSRRRLHAGPSIKLPSSNSHLQVHDIMRRPIYRKDIFFSGSVYNLRQFQVNPNVREYVASITSIPDATNQPCQSSCCYLLPEPVRYAMTEMLDPSLLRNFTFIMICLANIFCIVGMLNPFTYLRLRVLSLGMTETNAALFLSIIGITNTLGRILAGFLADLPQFNPITINNGACVICAIMSFVCLACQNVFTVCIFSAVFGLCFAAYISLTSVILCNCLGLDKLTNAFGLLTLVRGISCIFGPPFAGLLYDLTGETTAPLLFGAGCISIGAFFFITLQMPCLERFLGSKDRI